MFRDEGQRVRDRVARGRKACVRSTQVCGGGGASGAAGEVGGASSWRTSWATVNLWS